LSRREKFCLSFFVTYIFLYLTCFILFMIVPYPARAYRVLFVLSLLTMAASYKKIIMIFSDKEERKLLLQGLLMLLWLAGYQALHRMYGGGRWTGDWFEHFERARFLMIHYFKEYQFILMYYFPSRPPLFNTLCAFFLSFFGYKFWIFQIVCSLLNMSLVFPAWLLVCALFKKRRIVPLLAIIALFMLNPAMVRQMLYTMTKGLSAAYVLAGVYLYLKARDTLDRKYCIFAFLFLSAGVLVHYSAAPFFLGVGADFTILTLKKPSRKKFFTFACAAILSAAFIFTWLSYSLVFYGARITFLSNTSYTDSKNFSFVQRIGKDLYNLRTTFLPNLFETRGFWSPISSLKYIIMYDFSAVFYSESLTGNLTISLSLFLILFLLGRMKDYFYKSLRILSFPSGLFWILFLGAGGLIAIATNGGRMDNGTAHVSFVPVAGLVLGIAYLLAQDLPSKLFRRLLAFGMILESFFFFALSIIVLSDIFIETSVMLYSATLYTNYAIRDVNNLEFLEGIYHSYSIPLAFLVLIGWMIWAGIFVKSMKNGGARILMANAPETPISSSSCNP